jgi:hypothetical protein
MYVFTANMNSLQEYITVGIQSNILFVMSMYHVGIRYYIYIFTVNRNSLQDYINITRFSNIPCSYKFMA